MTNIEITVNDKFGNLSRSMQKALAFMLTRHMVSHCIGYGPPGNLKIRVAHPDAPCSEHDDYTSRVFSSSRILDAMVKREFVAYRFEDGACLVELTDKSFSLGTGLMSSVQHALAHANKRMRKVA